MSNHTLRSGLIRLAYQNPNLRPTLLPLIEKHAGVPLDKGGAEAEAKHVAENLARVLAAKLGGTVKLVESHEYDGAGHADASVSVPNLPSISSEDGDLTVAVNFKPEEWASVRFHYALKPRRLEGLAKSVYALSVGIGNHHLSTMRDAVDAAMKSIQALPALLEPARNAEALRRKAAGSFKKAIPELREWVQKALVQSGFAEPVTVFSHPVQSGGAGDSLGTMLTDTGSPFAGEYLVIEGLIGEEGRDVQIAQAVLARVRKVLTKALTRFSSNGVAAKLSSKPAAWSSYRYNTAVILYFKDEPVENMRLANDKG